MFNKGKTVERTPSASAAQSANDKEDLRERVTELENILQEKHDEVDRLNVKIELLRTSLSQVRCNYPTSAEVHSF
jgi:molecular chaperone GrpE (heat shock protein)